MDYEGSATQEWKESVTVSGYKKAIKLTVVIDEKL
jgi:hypothetical protein